MGAPIGNRNATRGRTWTHAVERALERRTGNGRLKAIDALAEKLLDACYAGDLDALKELGNRLEGKPAQVIMGPNEGPVQIQQVERVIVRAQSRD